MKQIKRRWIIFIAAFLVCLIALLLGVTLYVDHLIKQPDERVSRAYILRVISAESPVLYRDGKTQLGVFFSDEHRRWAPIEEVPEIFQKAVVSAEDKDFYEHGGISIKGILKAMWTNIRAGRIVAGGSTITQQTAKNVYYRQGRSIAAKLEELKYSLKLEANYSKDEILEFYINQFHVNANGRGLAIASRYFFDKDFRDLNLIESAFLAGSVKGPYLYNPFVGSVERRERAKRLARERADYVLRRMFEDGCISETEFKQALKTEIPFKLGRFRYKESAALTFLREHLTSAGFEEMLKEHDIDNPATAGLRIITTLDANAQQALKYGLRHALTDVGGELEGIDGKLATEPPSTATVHAVPSLERFGLYNAKLLSLPSKANDFTAQATIGENFQVNLNRGSFERICLIEKKHKVVAWAKNVTEAELEECIKRFKQNMYLQVSISEFGKTQNEPVSADIELQENLEGAGIMVHDGELIALTGGKTDTGYNRAIQAKRQVGSTFKPFVAYLALTLGWQATSVLPNKRGVFPFQRTAYFPRPDHKNAPEEVSLAWMVTKSENLAAVNLLNSLTNKLNSAQFKELADMLGMTQRETESYENYVKRIRDEKGILVNQDEISRALFRIAKEEVTTDLTFDDSPHAVLESKTLETMHYGAYFDQFRQEINVMSFSPTEQGIRLAILANNFLDTANEAKNFEADLASISEAIKSKKGPSQEVCARFFRHKQGNYLAYNPGTEVKKDFEPVTCDFFVKGEKNIPEDSNNNLKFAETALIGGRLSLATITKVNAAMARQGEKIKDNSPYSPETLFLLDDFRVLVGLEYARYVAKALGIESEILPVLSLPLGSNEITLAEAALLYEGISTGSTYKINFPNPQDSVLPFAAIMKIEDEDGNVLYEMQKEATQLSVPEVPAILREMLKKVVEFGTARRAHNSVFLTRSDADKPLSVSLPLAGKTGTTNDYTNATFFGFLPAFPSLGGFEHPDSIFALATYSGYDDNTSMITPKKVRMEGARGALPIFINTAFALEKLVHYGDYLDPADLEFIVGSDLVLPTETAVTPTDVSIIDGKQKKEIETEEETTSIFTTVQPLFSPVKIPDG